MRDRRDQTKKHVSKRAAERQRARRRQRLWTIGLAVLTLAGLAGLAAWAFGREKAPAATSDLSRSKGSENAPVLVEEYGDFQ